MCVWWTIIEHFILSASSISSISASSITWAVLMIKRKLTERDFSGDRSLPWPEADFPCLKFPWNSMFRSVQFTFGFVEFVTNLMPSLQDDLEEHLAENIARSLRLCGLILLLLPYQKFQPKWMSRTTAWGHLKEGECWSRKRPPKLHLSELHKSLRLQWAMKHCHRRNQ